MLTSITPLGEQGRGNRWAVTTTAYAAGCLLGGSVTGLVLGAVGAVLPSLPVLVLAGAALGFVSASRPWVRVAVTDLAASGTLRVTGRQAAGAVPAVALVALAGAVAVLTTRRVQLGLGVVTVVTSAATYAVLVLAVLTQSALGGLLVGGVFGLARAVPAVLLGRSQAHADILSTAAGLERQAAAAARATAAALFAAGTVLLVAA